MRRQPYRCLTLDEGGLAGLSVADNGRWMSADDGGDWRLLRHATSKLADDDLLAIAHFWLSRRSLALYSLGRGVGGCYLAPARAEHGWHLRVAHGTPEPVLSLPHRILAPKWESNRFIRSIGTIKIPENPKNEATDNPDVVKRLAMLPCCAFRQVMRAKTCLIVRPADNETDRQARLAALIGTSFAREAVPIDVIKRAGTVAGSGRATNNEPLTTSQMYLFVNNRPVRDHLDFWAPSCVQVIGICCQGTPSHCCPVY